MQMYYWVDDWAMTYKVLYPEEAPGNMGPGIFGTGPYRYLVTPFIALYPLFGFNAFAYFAIGWILYFLAAVSVYLLAKELTQKHIIGVAASSIFASGYIGAHALYRLTNSYQTVGATLFICLTVWVFARFLRTQKNIFLWVSLALYITSMELFWIRTHGLFLSLLAVTILYKISNNTRISTKKILTCLFPFLAMFYFLYFVDPRIKIGSDLVLSGMDAIIKEGHMELFNNLMITLSNAFVPEDITYRIYAYIVSVLSKQSILTFEYMPLVVLTFVFALLPIFSIFRNIKRKSNLVFKIVNIHSLFIFLLILINLFVLWSAYQRSSLWSPRPVELFTALLGNNLTLSFLYITLRKIKSNFYTSLLIPLTLFWVLANSITLFIYSPETSLESTSRYLVPAFAGIGILYATLFFLVFSRTKAIFIISILCMTLIFYSNKEADMLIKNVSSPDKQGYGLILQEVSKVDKDTVFFVETEDDPKYKGTYLGRLPQLGISALYRYQGITTLADSYDHLFSLLESGKTNINQVHTYFFGKDGYKSTTIKMRRLLETGGEQFTLNNWSSGLPSKLEDQNLNTQTIINTSPNQTVGVNPSLETTVNYESLVPSVLEFTMAIQPLGLNNIIFPYFDITYQHSPQIGVENIDKIAPLSKKIEKLQLLSTLKEESMIQDFRNNTSVKATSSWKTTEELYLIDGREDTNWGADNNQWSSIPKPQDVIIDLGKVMNITKLVRINHHHMATPTVYSISSSIDGINWIKVLYVKSGGRKDGGEIIIDKLPAPIDTRFLKINILETFGGPGYPPAIKELWVSNLVDDIDPSLSKKIVECPFCYINNLDLAQEVIELTSSIAKARVSWETDRQSGFNITYSKEFDLILDGQPHAYKVFLPANGSTFKRLKIDSFQVPINVSFGNASIRSLSLDEIKKEALIKSFDE